MAKKVLPVVPLLGITMKAEQIPQEPMLWERKARIRSQQQRETKTFMFSKYRGLESRDQSRNMIQSRNQEEYNK